MDDLLPWCSWRRKSEMICFCGVAGGGDQRWFCFRVYLMQSWSFQKRVDSGTARRIGATGVEVSSGRGAASGMALKWRRLLVTWTHVVFLWGTDFNHYRRPRSSACQSLRERSEKAKLVKDSSCLSFDLTLVNRERSGSLMWILLNWLGDRATTVAGAVIGLTPWNW